MLWYKVCQKLIRDTVLVPDASYKFWKLCKKWKKEIKVISQQTLQGYFPFIEYENDRNANKFLMQKEGFIILKLFFRLAEIWSKLNIWCKDAKTGLYFKIIISLTFPSECKMKPDLQSSLCRFLTLFLSAVIFLHCLVSRKFISCERHRNWALDW
jgi:hypothetical protein